MCENKISQIRDSYLLELVILRFLSFVILRHYVFFICIFIQKCVSHRKREV